MDAAEQSELMNALAETTAHDSRAVQLLRTIVDEEQGITRQALAALWRVSDRAVSYMLDFRIHISIERWAALFEELRDERILRLLVDPRRYAVYSLPEVGNGRQTSTVVEAFLKLRRLAGGHALFVERLLGILEDLRVDGDDGELIADLRHTLPEYIAAVLAAATHVDAMYEHWCAHRGEGNGGKAVAR